jgi:hypothetical protein
MKPNLSPFDWCWVRSDASYMPGGGGNIRCESILVLEG